MNPQPKLLPLAQVLETCVSSYHKNDLGWAKINVCSFRLEFSPIIGYFGKYAVNYNLTKKLELTNFFSISKLLNLNFHCQKLLRCKCTFPIFFCLCKIFGDLRRHLSLISNEKMSNLTSKATLLKYRLLCPPWLLCDKIAVNFEH